MRIRLGDGLEISDDSLQNGCFSLLVDPYCSIRHPLGPPYRGEAGVGDGGYRNSSSIHWQGTGKNPHPQPLS